MSDRRQQESLASFTRRMVTLLERPSGPSPDAELRAVATVIGQLALELADECQESKRRIDALLAAETEGARLYEKLRIRVDLLETDLGRVRALADRAALHAVPFGGAQESPGPLMPDLARDLPPEPWAQTGGPGGGRGSHP